MAVAKKAQSAIDIWKKKKWYSLIAPSMFNNISLGETMAFEPEELTGRCATINLMTITRNPKRQHINITFEVERVSGDSAFTKVKKIDIHPSAIRRMVRRRRNRIDDSFQCLTADGYTITVKPFLLTNSPAHRSIETKIRKISKDEFMKAARKKTYDMLIDEIINNKLQREINDLLHKIWPLRTYEVRSIELEKKEKVELPALPEEPKQEVVEEKVEEAKAEEEVKEEAPEAKPEKKLKAKKPKEADEKAAHPESSEEAPQESN